MKIFFDVIGCRLNQSEVESFANTFRALGHQIVADPAEADLAIVNTCAVTVKAAADSRKQLRHAARAGAGRVIATGCWATIHPEAALELPGVSDVFTNNQKDELVASVLSISQGDLAKLTLVREPLPGDRGRTRAFIKVQDGCDNYCTYCLTRLARGKSRSRSVKDIQRDIQAALNGGAKEMVLTGVQLGAWGRDLDEPESLTFLLHQVLKVSDIQRIRLSSIEPWDLDPEMFALWDDERMCRHLHIPLQSGSDRILKSMGRPITTDEYAELVGRIRSVIPDIALTTDVIAGFPGETEQDFECTKTFIRKVGFAGGHVFTYSPRPATAAFKMKEQVPSKGAKSRNAALRTIFFELGEAYRRQFIDQESRVLWESSELLNDGYWQLSGLTDNYIRVYSTANKDLWNQVSLVKLSDFHPHREAMVGVLSGSDFLDPPVS